MGGRVIGWARGVGFLLGLSAAIVSVLSWRIPAGSGTLGSDIAIAARPTGELALSTTAPFVISSGMHPGSAATGTVEVRNHSAAVLRISVAAEPSIADLDDLLWIEIDGDGRDLFRGTVGELRAGSTRTFELRPGQTTTLGVRGWLPTSVGTGYQGRIVDVGLVFEPEVVGRA
jgi:hypothetical protein